jgi:hypothetical protein
MSIDVNGLNDVNFWNKEINKDIFKEYFLLRSEYRELRINNILKNDKEI